MNHWFIVYDINKRLFLMVYLFEPELFGLFVHLFLFLRLHFFLEISSSEPFLEK